MKDLKNLTEEQIHENLQSLIKEAILNEDRELLEAIVKNFSDDQQLLQEVFPLLAVLGGLMAVGTAVEVSDMLGFTDNLYDDVVKYADPMHWASTGATKLAIETGLLDDSWDVPFIGATPDRLESGWGLKLIKNAFDSEKEFFEGIGLDEETKSEKTKRAERGESSAEDLAEDLYNALKGITTSRGDNKIKKMIPDPEEISDEKDSGKLISERDVAYFYIDLVAKAFVKHARKKGDDEVARMGLVGRLRDEGGLEKQAEIVEKAIKFVEDSEKDGTEESEEPSEKPSEKTGAPAKSLQKAAPATKSGGAVKPKASAEEDKLGDMLLDLDKKVKSGEATEEEKEIYNILGF